MRLKMLFAASSSLLLLSACLRPEKPKVEVCVVDYPRMESICGLSGQGANTKIERKPLSYLDKATAFNALNWEKEKNYIDKLEIYATDLEQNCK